MDSCGADAADAAAAAGGAEPEVKAGVLRCLCTAVARGVRSVAVFLRSSVWLICCFLLDVAVSKFLTEKQGWRSEVGALLWHTSALVGFVSSEICGARDIFGLSKHISFLCVVLWSFCGIGGTETNERQRAVHAVHFVIGLWWAARHVCVLGNPAPDGHMRYRHRGKAYVYNYLAWASMSTYQLYITVGVWLLADRPGGPLDELDTFGLALLSLGALMVLVADVRHGLYCCCCCRRSNVKVSGHSRLGGLGVFLVRAGLAVFSLGGLALVKGGKPKRIRYRWVQGVLAPLSAELVRIARPSRFFHDALCFAEQEPLDTGVPDMKGDKKDR